MGLIEIKKDFSHRELMWFGPLFALFAGLIGYLFIYPASPTAAYVAWSLTALLIVLYYAIPPLRQPLYMGWMYSVMPIGWVISHILLAIIYYLILTPIGLALRLFGYDSMQRKFDPSRSSYWIPREATKDIQRYFKQF